MKVRDALKRIQEEPPAVGEPAESIQIGRLQVVDEILPLLNNEDSEMVEVDRERLMQFLVKVLPQSNDIDPMFEYLCREEGW